MQNLFSSLLCEREEQKNNVKKGEKATLDYNGGANWRDSDFNAKNVQT